jgi:hypothetical protein
MPTRLRIYIGFIPIVLSACGQSCRVEDANGQFRFTNHLIERGRTDYGDEILTIDISKGIYTSNYTSPQAKISKTTGKATVFADSSSIIQVRLDNFVPGFSAYCDALVLENNSDYKGNELCVSLFAYYGNVKAGTRSPGHQTPLKCGNKQISFENFEGMISYVKII